MNQQHLHEWKYEHPAYTPARYWAGKKHGYPAEGNYRECACGVAHRWSPILENWWTEGVSRP